MECPTRKYTNASGGRLSVAVSYTRDGALHAVPLPIVKQVCLHSRRHLVGLQCFRNWIHTIGKNLVRAMHRRFLDDLLC